MKKHVAYAAALALLVSASGVLAAETFEQGLSRIFHSSGIKAESAALQSSVAEHSAQMAAEQEDCGGEVCGRRGPGYGRPGRERPRYNPGRRPPIFRHPHRDWGRWGRHRGWGSHHGRWGWDGNGRPHWWGWIIWRGVDRFACVNYYNNLQNSCNIGCQQEHNACVASCGYDWACAAQCGSNDNYCRYSCQEDRNLNVGLRCR